MTMSGPGIEVLVTPRLTLAPFGAEEARQVVEDRRQANWDEGYPTPGDQVVARRVLNLRFAPTDERFGVRSIAVRSSGLLIGGIGFHGQPDEAGTVEIGYGIAAKWRGQGLGSEAVSAFVAHARSLPGVRTVVAATKAANTASVRALRRAGLCEVDRQGDLVRFATPV